MEYDAETAAYIHELEADKYYLEEEVAGQESVIEAQHDKISELGRRNTILEETLGDTFTH